MSYADLCVYQAMAGLDYAFPMAMARCREATPALADLRHRVAGTQTVARYLASVRRTAFNQIGVFLCYPELDTLS